MKELIIVRGAGDLASGIIYKLFQSGFHVVATDIAEPTSIRRAVSFSEAMYFGEAVVEDLKAVKYELDQCLEHPEHIALINDPTLEILKRAKPLAVVDAIIAKKNLGTNPKLAPIVIAVGPGFDAPTDCHAVIESARGHDLGRVIYNGSATPNTGIPGVVAGHAEDRVFHAIKAGKLHQHKVIGDLVEKGETVLTIDDEPMNAPFAGVLRGILPEGFIVPKGMKCADIDPRFSEVKNCFTISDKARTIAGAVLEAIMHLKGVDNE